MAMRGARWWMAVCMAAALPCVAAAQTDPGDLVFWQSVQNSKNPAEYRAYLEAYPNGRFAGLARARLADLGGGQAPAPAPAPVPAPGDGDASEYAVTVSPASGRVGQVFAVGCGDLPPGTYDQVVVVPAGTPVVDLRRGQEQSKVLWSSYTGMCSGQLKAGPFAPGAYELRWMTVLYNNETRFEVKAKASFTVR